MSQISSKRNVRSIEAVSVADVPFILLGAALTLTVKACSLAINEIIENALPEKSEPEKCQRISSPAQLRDSLREKYKCNLQVIQRKGFKPIEAAKASVIKTLQVIPYSVKNIGPIKEKLSAIMSSGASNIQSSINDLIAEVEKQHRVIFSDVLVSCIKKASIATGFKEVKVIAGENNHHVIAIDERGRGIVSAVSVNKNNEVDITTETVGFSDGTCREVMERFDAELKNQGIIYSENDTRWTGGACILPIAKKVKEDIKTNTNKQVEKSGRLNQPSRIKH